MIFLNVTDVMRRCDPENKDYYDAKAKECVEKILKYHFRPELKCTLETVGLDGELQTDTVAGRVVNPGHDIEGSWFLENEANYEDNQELRETAKQMYRYAIEAGWDKKYGGLLYFIDALGCPPEAYEHDMKLWWPHNEILIASMMFYRDTGDEYFLDWFFKTADYAKEHFADPQYGEWYGYLRRDGLPTEPACKGSTFKGPFHVPRCLTMLDQLMTQVEEKF
jgi:N-acylglucosamine 2-epimerase